MSEKQKNQNQQRVSVNVPYAAAYGRITTALNGIKTASTPDRFTQDFLSTKLAIKGGSAAPIIPFLKRTGFLNSDGTPTELYKQFRNDKLGGIAAAKALKTGYSALYEVNEYVHDANENDLKGVVVQATGLDSDSPLVKQIIGSFKALKAYAKFDAASEDAPEEMSEEKGVEDFGNKPKRGTTDIKLGYTINLNLPATSDIAVFNAIFKSLREHLLDN